MRLASLVAVLVVLLAPLAFASGEIESKKPTADAKPLVVYEHRSSEGLRFTWVVPEGYDGKKARNLTVICHGTGLDYRWGHWNNKPGIFRPHDIVVSVDGPAPNGETRLFLGDEANATAFAKFLGELRELFAVDKLFLYGHSQGGFFVVYFAGEHPELVSGVVAHASGAWNWSKTGAPVRKVAVAFLHGTADPVVPYGQSVGARDAYDKEGFELLHLRRLENYNHWPNAVRATECLDWCEGMTTDDPARALECARRLLEPKPADEYQWTTVVDFAGALDVLARLQPKAKRGFAQLPSSLALKAKALADDVDEHARKHVAALRKLLPKKGALALGAESPWLGHLIPLREDLRGAPSVEAFATELGYDKLLAAQAKPAGEIFSAWYSDKPPREIHATIVAALPKAFLVEGYPPELAPRIEEWTLRAKDLDLDDKQLKLAPLVASWRSGWRDGLRSYADLWKEWKLKGRD